MSRSVQERSGKRCRALEGSGEHQIAAPSTRKLQRALESVWERKKIFLREKIRLAQEEDESWISSAI